MLRVVHHDVDEDEVRIVVRDLGQGLEPVGRRDHRKTFLAEQGFGGTPDGLAVDANGDVWVALAYSECVLRVSLRTGESVRAIEIPGRGVYDCRFESAQRLLVATSDKDETNVLTELPGQIFAYQL